MEMTLKQRYRLGYAGLFVTVNFFLFFHLYLPEYSWQINLMCTLLSTSLIAILSTILTRVLWVFFHD